jgi:hypothetical protein
VDRDPAGLVVDEVSNYYDMDGRPMTLQQWAETFEDIEGRRIGYTELPGGCQVSTVWLGLDHAFGDGPPLIFESMVFGPDSSVDLDCIRYSTREQAELGHAELVTRWTGWTPGEDYPEDRELSPISQFLEMLERAEHMTSPDSMVVMYHRDSNPDDRKEEPNITCPVCGMTSYNPNDIEQGFCGNCHDWTGGQT